MLLLWWQRHRQPQRRHGSITRKRSSDGRRLVVSTYNFPVALVALLLMSVYMHWNHSRFIRLREEEDSRNNDENHEWGPSKIGDKISHKSNSTVKDFSQLPASVHREQSGNSNTKSSKNLVSLTNMVNFVDSKHGLPERKDYWNSLSSKFDAEHLRTAYVYKPGTIQDM